MDTSDGELKMELGALENPDLTVTVDYDTAKAIFVEQNPQAGMQAFMAGKIKVQGDMTKLMRAPVGHPHRRRSRPRSPGAGPGDHGVTLLRSVDSGRDRRCAAERSSARRTGPRRRRPTC